MLYACENLGFAEALYMTQKKSPAAWQGIGASKAKRDQYFRLFLRAASDFCLRFRLGLT